jgi:hypothetical protein
MSSAQYRSSASRLQFVLLTYSRVNFIANAAHFALIHAMYGAQAVRAVESGVSGLP